MKFRAISVLSTLAVGAFALTACTSASEEIGSKDDSSSKSSETTTEAPAESGELEALPKDDEAAALVPEDIAEKGYLVAGYSPTFEPFEFYDDDSTTIIGYDVDFLTAVGQVLGLEVRTEASSFDSIITGLSSGKYDISNTGIAVTEERKEVLDFVPFAQAGSGIGVPKGNPKDISNDFEALCGLKIGAGKGTTQGLTVLPGLNDECEAAGEDAIDIQLFPSENDGYLALQANRIDGYMADSFTVADKGRKADGAWELAPGEDFMPVVTGIATPKDSPLTPAVRAAVLKVIASDNYLPMNEKWGVPESTMITAEQANQE